MTHVESDLTAYLDGALASARRAEVEAHLAGCAACQAARDRLAWVGAAVASLPPPPPPSPQFEARFQARLRAAGQPVRRSWLASLRWRWVAPLAAAAGAGALVLVLWSGTHRRQVELASHLELLENYELVASVGAVESDEDVAVVAHLDELGEGKP